MAKKKYRKKRFQDFVLSRKNRNYMEFLFNLYANLNKGWKIKIKKKGPFIQIVDGDSEVFIIHPSRIPFYKNSVNGRLLSLLNDYMIDPKELSDGDTIIDCGANIGELGLALRSLNTKTNYIAFEPGRREYEACVLNNPESSCERFALWSESCTLNFYEKSESADSSLIEFGNHESVSKVDAITIDQYCRKNDISHIRYLKIEAEGAEPEVLLGAQDILATTKYVTVDCGFERGVAKESTLPQVANFLLKNGFELKNIKESRIIILFENTNILE